MPQDIEKDTGMYNSLNEFYAEEIRWKKEFTKLRSIVLKCNLKEELKWGKPCFSYNNKNVLLIHGFKEYCAILFIKGALINDSKKILIQQTKNVQAGRQIRFKDFKEIDALESEINEYILEAIEIEKLGKKVEFKDTKEYNIPEELQTIFNQNEAFKSSFNSLTPGRQRGYILFFSNPKQSKTRIARIEKNIDRIMEGFGLND